MKHKFHIQIFDTLPSSNDYAKEHIQKLKDKEVIYCKQQTKGRGRFHRIWQSGNDLTFTMVFHDIKQRDFLIPLSLVYALRSMNIETQIKWPNDILWNGKKVCGILIEKVYEGNQCIGEVCGMGINVSPVPLELLEKATYVQVDKEQLLHKILEQYEQLETLTKEDLRKQYQSVSYLQGRKILLNDVLWNVINISEEGYLVIQNQDKIQTLTSEEVTLSHIY